MRKQTKVSYLLDLAACIKGDIRGNIEWGEIIALANRSFTITTLHLPSFEAPLRIPCQRMCAPI